MNERNCNPEQHLWDGLCQFVVAYLKYAYVNVSVASIFLRFQDFLFQIDRAWMPE